jgi:ribosome-associated translation inhibitor RaiA
MDRPLEIAFHHLQHSDSVEAEIRAHVDRLETRFGRLTGCRVTVESLHQMFEVHIVLSVPGQEIAVSHEPHHAKQRRAHPDAHSAVKEAFKAAERRLDTYKRQHRGHEQSGDTVFAT